MKDRLLDELNAMQMTFIKECQTVDEVKQMITIFDKMNKMIEDSTLPEGSGDRRGKKNKAE